MREVLRLCCVAVIVATLAVRIAAQEHLPTITVPKGPIAAYQLVRVSTTSNGRFLDLLVLSVQHGNVVFVDSVSTANRGEWVFAGPPGDYSLRLSIFDAENGIVTATAKVTIAPPGPNPPGPNPPGPNPPGPNPPGPNPPGPIPDGRFAFGPMAYAAAMQVPPQHRGKAAALADNFRLVANRLRDGDLATPGDAVRELAGKNNLTLAAGAEADAWKAWRVAWKTHADQLTATGKLTNNPDDYVAAFFETAVGLNAATR